MKKRVIWSFVLLVVLGRDGRMRGEEQADLRERMKRAAEITSLDEAGTKPWHLKLNVETFDVGGKSKGKSSVEEWWAGPKMYRVVYEVQGSRVTELRNAQGSFRSKDEVPEDLRVLLAQAVHPLPSEEEWEGGTLSLQPKEFSKVALECLVLQRATGGVKPPPRNLSFAYCMDPGGVALRAVYGSGGILILRNRLGTFLNKKIATAVELSSTRDLTTRSTVEILKTEELTETDCQPSTEMQKVGEMPERVASNVAAGLLLRSVTPIYPEMAKRNHISGKVVLHAVIDKDGHVHSLDLISSPDGQLATAASHAVKQWVYRPYVLLGQPTEVDTTVTVNFQISP